MQDRGFDAKWISWLSSWLTSSQSCININGDLTPYFFCKRGVRQGDPLSPYLFNLAADSLCKLFHKGKQTGLITGLGPPCSSQQSVTNCHYADDTILFLRADQRNVERAWWLMVMFESISGIRMNLDKTALYPINLDIQDSQLLAATFHCQLAQIGRAHV